MRDRSNDPSNHEWMLYHETITPPFTHNRFQSLCPVEHNELVFPNKYEFPQSNIMKQYVLRLLQTFLQLFFSLSWTTVAFYLDKKPPFFCRKDKKKSHNKDQDIFYFTIICQLNESANHVYLLSRVLYTKWEIKLLLQAARCETCSRHKQR